MERLIADRSQLTDPIRSAFSCIDAGEGGEGCRSVAADCAAVDFLTVPRTAAGQGGVGRATVLAGRARI